MLSRKNGCLTVGFNLTMVAFSLFCYVCFNHVVAPRRLVSCRSHATALWEWLFDVELKQETIVFSFLQMSLRQVLGLLGCL